MSLSKQNRLVVEGKDDKFAIIGLMQHHIKWGNTPDSWPVEIVVSGSVTELIERIPLDFKAPGIKRLGLMLDADENFSARWKGVNSQCQLLFPDFPDKCSPEGVIVENIHQQRLGIWIMPDNQSVGMLETFLKHLAPADEGGLWEHAKSSANQAKELHRAPWKEVHKDKAKIHTWLAWQDPPGERLGIALTKKILDPKAHYATSFVEWFINLFDLNHIRVKPQ